MIILRENDNGLYVGKAPIDGDVVKLRRCNGTWEMGECCGVNAPSYDIELQGGSTITIELM
jgi:hypothetical protein